VNGAQMNEQEDLATSTDQELDSTTTGSETMPDDTESGDATDHIDDVVSPSSELNASLPLIEALAPKARKTRKKSEPKKKITTYQMLELERGNIYDEHPLVGKIRDEFKIALRELPVSIITSAGLVSLAKHFPLRVVSKDDKYYCIGGLRLYRLLRYDVSARTHLHVIQQGGLSENEIRSHIYFDLLAMPIINGLSWKDRSSLSSIWKTEKGKAFFSQAFGSDDSEGLAKILGCDSRTLKKEKIETPSS